MQRVSESSSLASLLLGTGGGGDHLGLFHQAMQSVVSDNAAAYEMHNQQQQHQAQVDQLLGLGYGSHSQIQMNKPWLGHDGAGGLFDGFYAPLLSGCSIVPGLEELHVKAEATAGENHHQHKKDGEQQQQQSGGSWEQHPNSSSSNVEACNNNIMASEALMAAMNPAAAVSSNAATAPTTVSSSQLMYWGNGGGAPAAWPDIGANCGSSIATFF